MNDLLRPRHGHASEKVSFVELFFDLVFVFAVTQLSHSLIGHFSLIGALQTLMALLAMWWVWIFTAWVTNWLDPEKQPVRCLLLVMMIVGLVFSAAIPNAFGSRGLAFAGSYVTLQLGRTLFFLWAVKNEPGIFRGFQRIICWLGAGSIFWIMGGFMEGSSRIACWGLALLIEYISPSAGFYVPGLGKSRSTDWQVSGHHMAERCGLFIIIALGESLLVTGATFSGLEWTTPLISAFVALVLGSIAMWWLYFDTASDFGTHVISSSENPGHLARLAYTYLHLFLVAGIILSAAADEFVLAHPTGHTDAKTAIALLGGAALYLLGNVLFKKAISGRTPWSHLVATTALALLGAASAHLAPWLLATFTALVLVAVAWWERHSRCLRD
ncbi:low temperature requirement protein A [Luteolibacter soli]|uniref:Low temperature requirement protein A n=1 Tax=Luteolibacter soli TaxID=3135280 RepID=A0ABU9AZI9_9BACT